MVFRFYSNTEEGKPRITVVAEHSAGMLKVAVARCSNKDHFIRKKGRMIAEGRLAKDKLFTTVEMESCDIAAFVEVAKEVAREVNIIKQVY
jgi:hypothetical protein